MITPICIRCRKTPSELTEFIEMAKEEGTTPDIIAQGDGTYNRDNGHFLCTHCYIKAGMPSSPQGWIAP